LRAAGIDGGKQALEHGQELAAEQRVILQNDSHAHCVGYHAAVDIEVARRAADLSWRETTPHPVPGRRVVVDVVQFGSIEPLAVNTVDQSIGRHAWQLQLCLHQPPTRERLRQADHEDRRRAPLSIHEATIQSCRIRPRNAETSAAGFGVGVIAPEYSGTQACSR